MSYVLLTKFWNETQRIPGLVETILKQEVGPDVWLLLDDGSTDGSLELFERLLQSSKITTLSVSMPKKAQGNLDTIGKVYQLAFDTWREHLTNNFRPSYLAMLDVDSRIPKKYFRMLSSILEQYPRVGAIAGQIKAEPERTVPQGSGKMVRWEIVECIDQFWDLDADAFLNIKANALDYWCMIVNNLYIDASPSLFYSTRGAFRVGRRMFYVGRPLPVMLFELARGIFERKRAFLEQFNGWSLEAIRNDWKCGDKDVMAFYGLRRFLTRNKKRTKVVRIDRTYPRLVCQALATC